MFNIGPAELMVIFVLALLVFGPKKLPEVSKQIGRGIREFRKASDQFQGEIQGALNLDDEDDDHDETPDDAPDGTSRETTISANGHSAGSANTVPEPRDGGGWGPEWDDGGADGPGASERAD